MENIQIPQGYKLVKVGMTDSQKKAQKKYVENNKERINEYKRKYYKQKYDNDKEFREKHIKQVKERQKAKKAIILPPETQ